MGQPVARVGDKIQGICDHGQNCCPHSVVGQITQGAQKTTVEGMAVARINDPVMHNCPHCGTGNIIAGSQTVMAEGQAVAHLNDKVLFPGGQGIIIGSAQKTTAA